MGEKDFTSPFSFLLLFFLSLSLFLHAKAFDVDVSGVGAGPLVKKEERRSLVVTEYGEISATEIIDGMGTLYHLQFLTLEPNSLFLPVLLHSDMVFFVNTGSGRLSWVVDQDEMRRVNVRRGDIYRLRAGSIFYIQSSLAPERQKLRIHAIFANTEESPYEQSIGAYSSINNLVRGFDKKVLQAAFKVPEDLIEAITEGTNAPAIVHAVPTKEKTLWELEARFLKVFLGDTGGMVFSKKTRTFNILEADPDIENCYGRSTTVTRKNFDLLKDSNIGLFLVNLTKGSMMGPHWNPMATEMAIVLQGQGMVRAVCSSSANESECKNMRFMVMEGDVFTVPRFHPMAQMSFNNDSFVFMGFSTTRGRNHPQFLAGKRSVLQTLDKEVLAVSFNVTNTTIDQLLAPQADSILLECTSCAEEERRIMEEETEREKEEEEARKREEEEKEKEKEEEEARKREEEEREKEREEEARKREEEEREEEARKREEEKRREEEEAAARKREEEEEEEEEEARRQEEAREEKAEREQEGARRSEEGRRRREEEEKRRREEEAERRERQPEEEERRQEEEAEKRREEAKWEEEEARRQEEERRQEEAERRREEAKREVEEARRQEEERRRQEEEERREWGEEEPAGRQSEEEWRVEQEGQDENSRRKEQEEEGSSEEGRRALRIGGFNAYAYLPNSIG